MQSITRFQAMKAAQQKISMVTCYDFWSAQLVAESAVDSILVGLFSRCDAWIPFDGARNA